MTGLFDGTPWERPVTCARCGAPRAACTCPRNAAGEITLPANQAARVRREKRGGKVVTVVTGLDPVATDLAALVKAFRPPVRPRPVRVRTALAVRGHRAGVQIRWEREKLAASLFRL